MIINIISNDIIIIIIQASNIVEPISKQSHERSKLFCKH